MEIYIYKQRLVGQTNQLALHPNYTASRNLSQKGIRIGHTNTMSPWSQIDERKTCKYLCILLAVRLSSYKLHLSLPCATQLAAIGQTICTFQLFSRCCLVPEFLLPCTAVNQQAEIRLINLHDMTTNEPDLYLKSSLIIS